MMSTFSEQRNQVVRILFKIFRKVQVGLFVFDLRCDQMNDGLKAIGSFFDQSQFLMRTILLHILGHFDHIFVYLKDFFIWAYVLPVLFFVNASFEQDLKH